MSSAQNSTAFLTRSMLLLKRSVVSLPARRIASHILLNAPTSWPKGNSSLGELAREREKAEVYKTNKRLSMWQQNRDPEEDEEQEEEEEVNKRFDDIFYKGSDIHNREYPRTWTNFPEPEKPRPREFLNMDEDEALPIRRRKNDERPHTAGPWDEEAKSFISQWDSNKAAILRSKTSSPTYCYTPPFGQKKETYTNDTNVVDSENERERQFYY